MKNTKKMPDVTILLGKDNKREIFNYAFVDFNGYLTASDSNILYFLNIGFIEGFELLKGTFLNADDVKAIRSAKKPKIEVLGEFLSVGGKILNPKKAEVSDKRIIYPGVGTLPSFGGIMEKAASYSAMGDYLPHFNKANAEDLADRGSFCLKSSGLAAIAKVADICDVVEFFSCKNGHIYFCDRDEPNGLFGVIMAQLNY